MIATIKRPIRYSEVRKGEVIPYLRPDGKTQVTVRYQDGRPVEIEKILISTQHRPDVEQGEIREALIEHVLRRGQLAERVIPHVVVGLEVEAQRDELYFSSPTTGHVC